MSHETAPIVCTLSTDAVPGRIDAWRALGARVIRRSSVPGGVRLTFDEGVSVADVAQLALAEHACCGFITFTLTTGDELTLEVTAPPEAAPLVVELFGSPD